MKRTALLCLPLLALTACGGGGSATAATGVRPVTVTATDDGCALSRTELTEGRNVFAVTNRGSGVTEVYLYADGDRIVTEKENITPGLSYELTAQVPAGSYEVACKPGMTGDGIRTAVTVAPAASTAPVDPAATKAVEDYRAYVQQQTDALVPLVQRFTAAVKAGDVAAAKAAYAPSREPWEAVEPVAEAFGDLDPRTDLREADLEPGQEWTGWHRLEKALWVDGSTAGLAPVADQLLADVTDLRGRVQNADLSPASIGNGAKELLDEVATGKVTGEEEAFSHTDLVDVDANVRGAEKALDVLRPLVDDAALLTELDTAFAGVDTALAVHRRGSTYVSYDTVPPAQRRVLAQAVDALGEPLSRLAAAASVVRLSRRSLFVGAGAAAAAGVVATRTPAEASPVVPFHGPHQAGITTPVQGHLHFASFDVTTRRSPQADRAALVAAAAALDRGSRGPHPRPPAARRRRPARAARRHRRGRRARRVPAHPDVRLRARPCSTTGSAWPTGVRPPSPTCRPSPATPSTRPAPAATCASRPAPTTPRSPSTPSAP